MKKIVLQTLFLFLLSIIADATTISKALLDHNGNVTLFDGEDMQAAVDAAVDGDVIYLSLGTFNSFTINKKISIVGTGETSIIDGDVLLSISESSTQTNIVIETIAISGSIKIESKVNNVILRKCKMSTFTTKSEIDDAIIDRCSITEKLMLSSYIKGMTVNNSLINGLSASSNASNNTTFVNCDINKFEPLYFSGTIINSCLYSNNHNNSYSSADDPQLRTIYSSIIINSYIRNNYSSPSSSASFHPGFLIDSSSVTQNCYRGYESSHSKADLEAKGYLGNDGTVVGIYGGDTPYTLKPSVPNVNNSSIKVDAGSKVLNVKLTVSPQ